MKNVLQVLPKLEFESKDGEDHKLALIGIGNGMDKFISFFVSPFIYLFFVYFR